MPQPYSGKWQFLLDKYQLIINNNEAGIRLGMFLGVFVMLAVWQIVSP